jgi:hypothetical protein
VAVVVAGLLLKIGLLLLAGTLMLFTVVVEIVFRRDTSSNMSMQNFTKLASISRNVLLLDVDDNTDVDDDNCLDNDDNMTELTLFNIFFAQPLFLVCFAAPSIDVGCNFIAK